MAIIPAAGQGTRMGAVKQLLDLKGKPVLIRTIEAFEGHDEVDEIIISAPKNIAEIIGVYGFKKIRAVVPGGDNRQASVWAGLDVIDDDETCVLIHDGARPLLSKKIISDVLGYVRKGECAVSGVISKDTIKITDGDNLIRDTPSRERTWLVQTPQGFPCHIIKKAHLSAKAKGFIGTDDAVLVERIAVPVRMVKGEYSNIKLTTPDDLQLAEALISAFGNPMD